MPKKANGLNSELPTMWQGGRKTKVDRKLKSLLASSIVIAAVFGLVVPVQAFSGVYGHVYNPDGTPAEGVEVTATNL